MEAGVVEFWGSGYGFVMSRAGRKMFYSCKRLDQLLTAAGLRLILG